MDITHSIPEGKIGVMVSGGLDSALLWFMVQLTCKRRGQVCIPFTVPKRDGAAVHARNVVETLNKVIGVEVQRPIIVGAELVDEPNELVTNGVKEVFEHKMCDHLYIAMTAFTDEFEHHTTPHPRFVPNEELEKIITWPFKDMTKDQVLQMAFDMDIANTIIPITHSCTEQESGRCNECYWCKERAWAFGKIKQKDFGEN